MTQPNPDFPDLSLAQIWDRSKDSIKRLEVARPVRIFGAGEFAADLVDILQNSGYRIQGIIDSNPKQSSLKGLPVVSWADAVPTDDEQLVIAIFNRSAPFNALEKIALDRGYTRIFTPIDIYAQFAELLGWRYWLSTPQRILGDREAIEHVHSRLGDTASQTCFRNILAFRLGITPGYGSFVHPEPQYFNHLTIRNSTQPLNYVDGGAYDGDSFRDLSRLVPIREAVLFEPDPENFAALQCCAAQVDTPVTCLPLGLSNTYEILSFSSGNGEGGTLSSTGDIHVACTSLDATLSNKPVDFLKLDVEGAEQKTLLGAQKLLNAHRPILAISLYHHPADLWEIPTLLDQIAPGYQLFIRQHYFNSFDSVLYALSPPEHP